MARTRIMYIENKAQCFAVIGRITFSQTGRTLYYQGRRLKKVGNGYKYNHVDEETGENFWISGPKKNGADGLYGHRPTPIDEDVREEYWMQIRNKPERKGEKLT
ncbi:MAG: hypothetical protein FWD53_13220 [Phycisphaerales bacterium]|nr:hypothetical protein [Phycisphaerales bacterium]